MKQFFFGIFLIAISGVGAWLGWHLSSEGWKNWGNEDIFKVNFGTTFHIRWPGPFLYIQELAPGKIISPIGLALFLEVTNNKSVISRITSYKCRALLEYDEGGDLNIIETKGKGSEFEYTPTGKIVEKWRTLYSMGYLGDQVYYVGNDNWQKAKRIDFSLNSFDRKASKTQMKPGESINGWIFFDIEPDLRGQITILKEIELTLTNSHNESQRFISEEKPREEETAIANFIGSNELHFMEGYYDLTKEEYQMIPYIDLLKKFGGIRIEASEKKDQSKDSKKSSKK